MKLLLAYEYGNRYLKSLYGRHPGLEARPYAEQIQILQDDYHGWPASVMKRAGEQGHQAEVIVFNCKPLQEAWARERGAGLEGDWACNVLLAQLESIKPDVVWMGMGLRYFGAFTAEVKARCRKLFVWIARPQPESLDLSSIDCILTSHSTFVDRFRRMGRNCEVLLPSFEQRILERLSDVPRDIPFSFAGDLSPAQQRRIRDVKMLVRGSPLLLWGSCMTPPPVLGIRSLGRRLWHHLFVDRASLKRRYQGEAWGMELYRILRRSRMTFNSHAEIANREAGNMRMFEATGCGAALVTENFSNLGRIFEPGKEVIAYGDGEDLARVVEYYLSHAEEAAELARRGQERTLRDHNAVIRAREFLGLCEKMLASE